MTLAAAEVGRRRPRKSHLYVCVLTLVVAVEELALSAVTVALLAAAGGAGVRLVVADVRVAIVVVAVDGDLALRSLRGVALPVAAVRDQEGPRHGITLCRGP